ncbi:MAG: class I SAM-dependent methyltransferase [Ignavibacteria bacterium]
MDNYLEHTEVSFDKIASEYDLADKANEIVQWMREVVHEVYLNNFKSGDELLEVNAGTGIDALFLANNGMKVYATDISERMIEILKSKVGEASNRMLGAEKISFSEIHQIQRKDFDGVISNFGGLNCINDFSKLSGDLALKIKRGGKFVAVVMNKVCPWEILYYSLKLDFKEAFRRFNKGGIDASLSTERVRTFYYTPKQFGKFFDEHFKIQRIFTLGFLTPSPYLLGIYERFIPFVKLLMKLDEIIKGIFPLNRFGDHFIIVMNRK